MLSPSIVAQAQAVAADTGVAEPIVTEDEARGRPLRDVIRVVIKSPCFDRNSLADGVEEWLGRDTVDGRVTSIVVRASQGLLSFAIELGELPPTVRDFPELPRDCVEQQSAIALSIALAITALETDLPAATLAPPPRFGLIATGTLTTGIPTTLGIGGGVSIEWRPIELIGLRIGAMGITTATDQRLPDARPFQYRSRLLTSRGDVCVRWEGNLFGANACAGVFWGALTATSEGQLGANTVSHGWYAAVGSAELRVPLGGAWGLLLGIDATVPLREITIGVSERGTLVAVQSFPSVVGGLRLGPTLSF